MNGRFELGITTRMMRPPWHRLFVPWKLATFAVATATMVGLAPVARDWTWTPDGVALMSGLTFLTAPFAVEAVRTRRHRGLAVVL